MTIGTQLTNRNGATRIVIDSIAGDLATCTYTRAGKAKQCKVYLATLRRHYAVQA